MYFKKVYKTAFEYNKQVRGKMLHTCVNNLVFTNITLINVHVLSNTICRVDQVDILYDLTRTTEVITAFFRHS